MYNITKAPSKKQGVYTLALFNKQNSISFFTLTFIQDVRGARFIYAKMRGR